MATFETEQARVIRVALDSKRTIAAWSATIAVEGTPRTIVVLAVTEKAAAGVAGLRGQVIRVGRASVRDLPGAITRALAAGPVHTPRAPRASKPPPAPAAPPTERKRAALYLQGFGPRPSDVAVYALLPRVIVRRVAGQPRRVVTAGTGRHVGTPFVSEYTLRGGRAA